MNSFNGLSTNAGDKITIRRLHRSVSKRRIASCSKLRPLNRSRSLTHN